MKRGIIILFIFVLGAIILIMYIRKNKDISDGNIKNNNMTIDNVSEFINRFPYINEKETKKILIYYYNNYPDKYNFIVKELYTKALNNTDNSNYFTIPLIIIDRLYISEGIKVYIPFKKVSKIFLENFYKTAPDILGKESMFLDYYQQVAKKVSPKTKEEREYAIESIYNIIASDKETITERKFFISCLWEFKEDKEVEILYHLYERCPIFKEDIIAVLININTKKSLEILKKIK